MNELSGNSNQEPEKPTLKNTVFEALGAASMCWDPRPLSAVFDSTSAETIGNKLMEQIESDVPNAINVLQKELAKDKSEGSYYFAWLSNIAMSFVDAFEADLVDADIYKIANNAAKNFLDLLISQMK